MDNPAFQNDDGVLARHPKKPLTRSNSNLTPTNKSWHLTQTARPKLCRFNSVLVSKDCCVQEAENHLDGPASLDYPFFANKSVAKSVFSDNSLWNKEFWSDSYNRLHDFSPVFQKFPLNKSGVSTIYDPQFLSSKFTYSGSQSPQHSVSDQDWWPGVWRWDRRNISTSQKAAAILCALLLTLLASGNVVYILKTVEKPVENQNKGTWVDVVLISGEFRLTNEPYRLALANHTSDDFQNLSSLISQQLDSLFSLSVISEPYHSTAVTELMPGLVVRCQIVLRAAIQLTASKVGLAFIGGLRNQHGHVWLGNFTVDIQSIGFQASGDAVSWSDWSQWGECQHTQEFGYVQVRSRNCTLYSGQYLHSTLPCLLVPFSHGNIETAPCPPPSQMDSAESNLVLSRVANITSRSEKIVTQVKVTRENCTSNNKTLQEIPINSSNPATVEQSVNREESVGCACASEQVCVALQEEVAPRCRLVLDHKDPTGCGGHCKINTQLCQKIQHNAFRCVEESKCLDDEWQCGNKLCIPQSKRCDGHFNCYDHTDEYDCDCIGAEQFTCNDSQCITNHRFCDGFPDCKDHSDEPFGCGGECKTHEWKCSNSRCILQSKRCNGSDDCGDTSDEADCPTVIPE